MAICLDDIPAGDRWALTQRHDDLENYSFLLWGTEPGGTVTQFVGVGKTPAEAAADCVAKATNG